MVIRVTQTRLLPSMIKMLSTQKYNKLGHKRCLESKKYQESEDNFRQEKILLMNRH